MILDEIAVTLRNDHDELHDIYINVHDNSLGRKWLAALNNLLVNNFHLEKNYCWLGWVESKRNLQYLCDAVNHSISVINSSDLGYKIQDWFFPDTVVSDNLILNRDKTNKLHRYFEDLQGWSGCISQYYSMASTETRWHIRQLNLLCHELESLVLSLRKDQHAPEWKRPSQLMCWLQVPRFQLDPEDYELFGIETINRSMGGVYVGVNKAVGKHHWEVFQDEGRDSRIGELVTSSLRSQTEAAGDFDIEWARDPGAYHWQIKQLQEFRTWLAVNGFDPEDKTLTIGHPQIGQVDLMRSFGTTQYQAIWACLAGHLDVYKITTSGAEATYEYRWSDPGYQQLQIEVLK